MCQNIGAENKKSEDSLVSIFEDYPALTLIWFEKKQVTRWYKARYEASELSQVHTRMDRDFTVTRSYRAVREKIPQPYLLVF